MSFLALCHSPFRASLSVVALSLLVACGATTKPGTVGVQRQQLLLVSATEIEHIAASSYAGQFNKAKASGTLVTSGRDYDRLRTIGTRLIQQAGVFREDSKRWQWQITLIDAPTLNASCAPGGKITFYTGIIRRLQLNDDEIAAIMGHEIAHALREHGRERVSQQLGQQFALGLLAATKNGAQYAGLAGQASNVLFMLPNSRTHESEADKMGVELMARAGYNPAAAINVWRKMDVATQGKAPPEFLSTHPSHSSRIQELTALQPVVRPLYEAHTPPSTLPVRRRTAD